VPDKQTTRELNEKYEKLHLYEFTGGCLAEHLENLGFEEIGIWPSQDSDGRVHYCDFLYKK